MDSMLHRMRPSLLLTALALGLLVVATFTLRDAPGDIIAAVFLLLFMLAGIGIGASVDTHAPRNHHR